jgi:hypothetical protein
MEVIIIPVSIISENKIGQFQSTVTFTSQSAGETSWEIWPRNNITPIPSPSLAVLPQRTMVLRP